MKTLFLLFIITVFTHSYNEAYVSWYGEKFDGKQTANGEKFDMNDFTAACVTLKFNTYVKITNVENGKSVIVRINDRGPYKMNKNGEPIRPLKAHPVRKFDLSKAAFSKISNLNKGVIKVKYEILK